jgi:glucose/arabinose dehydrogenase
VEPFIHCRTTVAWQVRARERDSLIARPDRLALKDARRDSGATIVRIRRRGRFVMKRAAFLAVALCCALTTTLFSSARLAAPQSQAMPAELTVPPGFGVSVFASDLAGARLMAVSPEGVLLVARRPRHEVIALPDEDKDGRAEPKVILTGLINAHSLAFKDGYLYVATTAAVMRVKWASGRPSGQPEKFADLPSSSPALHLTRTINVGPDGRLYVSIGTACNVCVETDPRRTTIQVINAHGSMKPYARGLHNAIGFDWDPGTGRLWADDTGQDNLGDDFPPDEINEIESGRHYGFPFLVGRHMPNEGQPELKDAAPDVTTDTAVAPALELPAHSTGMDLRFYRGTQFPAPYRTALFLALHGSPRRTTGYKVVRVVMNNGRPTGLEDFVTGWLKEGIVTGRPAGLATGSDGALYVSDDAKGFIYRIA